MKKMLLLFTVITCAAFFTAPAGAQEAFKFGYVDIQKVIFTSKTGKSEIQRVKGFQEARQKRITDAENELNQLEKDLSKQAFSLTDEAKTLREEEIRKKKLELKRLLEDSEYELAKRKKELLAGLNKDIVVIIQKFAKAENYALILEVTGSNVIYADTKYDLTDRIIAEYDK